MTPEVMTEDELLGLFAEEVPNWWEGLEEDLNLRLHQEGRTVLTSILTLKYIALGELCEVFVQAKHIEAFRPARHYLIRHAAKQWEISYYSTRTPHVALPVTVVKLVSGTEYITLHPVELVRHAYLTALAVV